MPAEIISLLSSPSLGPSPVQPAAPQSRPAHSSIDADISQSFVDDDVFDLTVDSPELAPKSVPKPADVSDLPNPTYPPRSVSGNKRPREGPVSDGPPVYFTSDDFDTTINLGSDNAGKTVLDGEPRDSKRPRLSPAPADRSGPLELLESTAEATNRPPVLPFGNIQRNKALDDPIDFSSSPVAMRQPKAVAPKPSSRIDIDDPFASSPPPPVQPGSMRQMLPETITGSTKQTAEGAPHLDSDPFASSPRAPPKPAPKPHTIILDDDDNDGDDGDEDPFSRPPVRRAVATSHNRPSEDTNKSLEKGKQKAVSPVRRSNWDPISSSAPERQLPSDPFSPSPPRRTFRKAVSEVIDLSDDEPAPRRRDLGSDDDFPDLDNFDVTRLKSRVESARPTKRVSSTTSKSTSNRTAPKKSADERARDKEAKAAEREREKERKKQEKDAAKEQKAREKQRAAALAEVNKIRTDKKVSTPEMIADLPTSLSAAVTLQIQTLLKDLDVQHTTWDSPVDNVVKWRRKVASRFNDELGLWEPIAVRIEPDKFALVILPASDFVNFALAPEGSDVESHVSRMKHHFPDQQLIYLIEGLTPWMRKNRNIRNRQFVSAVRNQSAEPAESASTGARRRKNQQAQEYVDEDKIENALLELQVLHNVLIHHTSAPVETAQWVAIFTQHISTVPYRKQREAANAAGAGFCMETGQVRTGDDAKDTYVRMLQEIVRVTAPIAYGIASEFETVPALVRGLEEGGPLVLENIKKSLNRDGGFSDRAVGKAISKRVYKVFTTRDEWSTDV